MVKGTRVAYLANVHFIALKYLHGKRPNGQITILFHSNHGLNT